MQEILITRSLKLTPFRFSDAEALVASLNSPAIYANTLLIPFPYRKEHADYFLSRTAIELKPNEPLLHFAIRTGTDRLIGGVGFKDLVVGHCVELGYWLDEDYWNRGIMTKVVNVAYEYAVREWEVVRVSATVFRGNEGSSRVLEKNGFQREGTLRKYYRKDDQFIDAIVFARLRHSHREIGDTSRDGL